MEVIGCCMQPNPLVISPLRIGRRVRSDLHGAQMERRFLGYKRKMDPLRPELIPFPEATSRTSSFSAKNPVAAHDTSSWR